LKRRGMYSDILTDRYLNDIVVAAPLHDIGKIHIPDAVLNKPGKLTEEEFEIMKTHTTAGEELLTHAKAELGESGYLNTAVEMAAYHHEWWNGKGYPYGISGEEIPLCARIMAVADVFDALTSKRCYKDAMPLEKAYVIIREESGTHFDPAVVEAFFAVTEHVESIVLRSKV
ncbi:MAG: HD domain-containing protein, partial [Acetatifactor muris]|nr:HD domain-containing protein [Acetatifactor muris]